jgi:hypothetical protein
MLCPPFHSQGYGLSPLQPRSLTKAQASRGMWRMKDSEAVLFIAVVTLMQPCGEGRGQRVPKPATLPPAPA